MSQLTVDELNKLRNSHPHSGRYYLSFLKPSIVYCGIVRGSPSRGDRQLTVETVSGSLANCPADATIYVGTFKVFSATMWKPMLYGQEGTPAAKSPYAMQTV